MILKRTDFHSSETRWNKNQRKSVTIRGICVRAFPITFFEFECRTAWGLEQVPIVRAVLMHTKSLAGEERQAFCLALAVLISGLS